MSDNPRSCGACTACCTALGVTELGKPMGARCIHVRDANPPASFGGCVIYASRPPSCRAYECGWLQGALPEEFRPDVVGFVIDPWVQPPDGGNPGVILREVREGALDGEAASVVIGSVIAHTVVYCLYLDDNRAFMGPDDRVKAILLAVLRPD